jgi:hypothetical protein
MKPIETRTCKTGPFELDRRSHRLSLSRIEFFRTTVAVTIKS